MNTVTSTDYFYNSGAGGLVYVAISCLSSIVMAGLLYFGVAAIPLWVVAAPFGQLVLRSWLYSLILNSAHEALRRAENDAVLDEIIAQQAEDSNLAVLDKSVFEERMK